MRLRMRDIGGAAVLAGALSGTEALGRLLSAAAQRPKDPTTLFLDFSEVEVATGSYLRESAIALKNILRATESSLYLVVANPNQEVAEELLLVLEARDDAILSCDL